MHDSEPPHPCHPERSEGPNIAKTRTHPQAIIRFADRPMAHRGGGGFRPPPPPPPPPRRPPAPPPPRRPGPAGRGGGGPPAPPPMYSIVSPPRIPRRGEVSSP